MQTSPEMYVYKTQDKQLDIGRPCKQYDNKD